MKNKKTKDNSQKIFFVTATFFLLNLLLVPMVTTGQSGGETEETQGGLGSTIEVTRTPFLSYNRIPSSLYFADKATSTQESHVYSNTQSSLAENNAIIVSDTRNAGGFRLQASVSGDLILQTQQLTPNIPAAGLRVVTSTEITPIPSNPAPVATEAGVIYLNGFTGERGIVTPVGISLDVPETCPDFGHHGTFTDTDCRTTPGSGNSLNSTVDLMLGCLPSDEGRAGKVQTGIAYELTVPRYTPAGTYGTTLTFTISDYTDNCPI